jgi:hypothetical protein
VHDERTSFPSPVPGHAPAGEAACALSPFELERAIAHAAAVHLEELTNRINYLHFMEESVLLQSFDPASGRSRLMRAYPGPCIGEKVVCSLPQDLGDPPPCREDEHLYLIMDDGRAMMVALVTLHAVYRTSLEIRLPQKGYVVNQRRVQRHGCREMTARVTCGGRTVEGEVRDFSPTGFRVTMPLGRETAPDRLRPGRSALVRLLQGRETVFSGRCRCLLRRKGLFRSDIVLEPLAPEGAAADSERIRNPRQTLTPSPALVFEHPFLHKTVRFHVSDISTGGVCVHERPEEGLLMPGMIIPELSIEFAGCRKMKSRARVVYRLDEGKDGVRCGLAILDMDIDAYSRLVHILTNALDAHAHVSGEVDMEGLWRFFFDSGFIYPKKYRLIQSCRDRFKETYRKLYEESPEVARHFTYQENSRISGHMSMIRSYKRTWMIQHHAAITSENRRAGIAVLIQIMQFLQDIHRLPSAQTEFVMCYYRPDNRFPERVFGGFARDLNDPGACSVDCFSYLPHTTLSLKRPLPRGWTLEKASKPHAAAFRRSYRERSGGLLPDVLGLEEGEDRDLEALYRKSGLVRRWGAYALTFRGSPRALMIANESNPGINLSELLNGIKILVIDPGGLPWDVLSAAIARLADRYDTDRVPTLIFPVDYVASRSVPSDKEYHLWIYDIRNVGRFKSYLKRNYRIQYW